MTVAYHWEHSSAQMFQRTAALERRLGQSTFVSPLSSLPEVIRPDITCDEVDRKARDVIREAGYGDFFCHSLGHGIGLSAHELPRLRQGRETHLEEGMVITVEPGIYMPGKGGIRLEETVVVERNSARVLTGSNYVYDFN